jgi:hypothetical protein
MSAYYLMISWKLWIYWHDVTSEANLIKGAMTFTLVYVVLSTTIAKNKIAPMAGLAIGFTLGLNVIFGGSVGKTVCRFLY